MRISTPKIRPLASLIWMVALALGLLTPTRLGAEAPPEGAAQPEAATKPPKDSDVVIYTPVGKRDPFRPPSNATTDRDIATANPLEKFSVDQLILKAILKRDGGAHAMVVDPESRSHIINEGQVIGRERATVSKILRRSVILTERTYNYLGEESLFEKFLYLPQDESDNLLLDDISAPAAKPSNTASAASGQGQPGQANSANPYLQALIQRMRGGNGNDAGVAPQGISPAPASTGAPSPSSATPPPAQPPSDPGSGASNFGIGSHVGPQGGAPISSGAPPSAPPSIPAPASGVSGAPGGGLP